MSTTLSEILIAVNAYTDLEASEPTGTELTTRIEFAKQAVREWSKFAQWPELSRTYVIDPSGSASISLPTDFTEFEVAPQQLSGGLWIEYPEIREKDKYGKASDDRYCYLLGDTSAGFTAVFNSLEASATLSITYQAQPSLMASLSSTCVVPDPEFVKTKVISYVLQSRSDDRFPTVNTEANRLLSNMVGRSQGAPKGGINRMPHNSTFRLE
jgi:hypothetical protein